MVTLDCAGALPWERAWTPAARLVPAPGRGEVRVPAALVAEVVQELAAVRALEAGAAPANDGAVAAHITPAAFAARFRGRR